ncbi:MAG: hypothetical protein ACLUKQ_04385 [Peptococcaceae bacterium]
MDFRLKFALQGQKHGRWETSSNMTAEGVPGFENMFVVKNYETGPITLYVQWAPPQQLDETIIVPLTEA